MLLEELVTIAEDICPFVTFCVNSCYKFISAFCTRENSFSLEKGYQFGKNDKANVSASFADLF